MRRSAIISITAFRAVENNVRMCWDSSSLVLRCVSKTSDSFQLGFLPSIDIDCQSAICIYPNVVVNAIA